MLSLETGGKKKRVGEKKRRNVVRFLCKRTPMSKKEIETETIKAATSP